jgi:hypothetical protein
MMNPNPGLNGCASPHISVHRLLIPDTSESIAQPSGGICRAGALLKVGCDWKCARAAGLVKPYLLAR